MTRLAARRVRKLARQIAKQYDGLEVAGDPEYIHRARVASRRLRAALDVFSSVFGKKVSGRYRDEIGKFARALSKPRDLDVQLLAVRDLLAAVDDSELVPGVAYLFARFQRERAELQPKVVRALERFMKAETVERLAEFAEKLEKKARKKVEKSGTNGSGDRLSKEVRRLAKKKILRRFGHLLDLAGCLEDPADVTGHHQMRIAAKKLRYTLEIFGSPYGGLLDETTTVVKQLQTYLGDIHDCDVWEETLESLASRIGASGGTDMPDCVNPQSLMPGIRWMQAHYARRREELYLDLCRFWHSEETQETLQNLPSLLDCEPPPKKKKGGHEASGTSGRSEDEKPEAGVEPDVADDQSEKQPSHNGRSHLAGPHAEKAKAADSSSVVS
ncbi:hypothetical protein JCM19992_30690 [Thermostilla marina]